MEPFIHVPEYPFVICQRCKIGLVISEVINHLKSKHGDICRQDAKKIKQMVIAIPTVAVDQAGLRGWILPPPIGRYRQSPRGRL